MMDVSLLPSVLCKPDTNYVAHTSGKYLTVTLNVGPGWFSSIFFYEVVFFFLIIKDF